MVVDEPAGEERRQRQLGEHDEVAAPRRAASCSSASSRSTTSLRVSVALDRPELRRPDREHPIRHARIIARSPDPHRVGQSSHQTAEWLGCRWRTSSIGSATCWRSRSRQDLRTGRALDGMTFAVRPGSVTGFLGPNGAGKTTTMRAVFGLTALDAGQVRWDGRPIDLDVRRAFGYLPEERGLYPTMKIARPAPLPRRSSAGWTQGRRRRRGAALARRARPRRSASTTSWRTSRSATSSASS